MSDPASAPSAALAALARRPEADLVAGLAAAAGLTPAERASIAADGAALVRAIRDSARPGLMEVFLAEYGLSSDEGIALMCLAEALLRVPDAGTMDALIEDKIAPSDWGRHLGRSASSLVNASTWALMLTGRVLDDDARPGVAGHLRAALKRLGEPVIRTASLRAMREMGRAFVLGEDIAAAMARARTDEGRGFTHSYDMLGEAARTEADAQRYHAAYAGAIGAIAGAAQGDVRASPGISVKLSALHPRYEVAQRGRVMAELLPRLIDLAGRAAAAGIGLNIDAEEQERLELSLELAGAALADPRLAGWDGFGVVVQAYGRRAGAVIEWLGERAAAHRRRLMVRLVKGAYWDSEIKRAQVLGLAGFPVFTRKAASDVAFLAHARRLLGMTNRLYPQFATHNAHSVAAILHMARGLPRADWEFQRLHGMGERLHEIVRERHATSCRIYAPVGRHRDLLAYLVRRLLENGANSSFVNRIVDASVPAEAVAADPFAAVAGARLPNPTLRTGARLFAERANSRGRDLADTATLAEIEAARAPFRSARFAAAPLIAAEAPGGAPGSARTAPPGRALLALPAARALPSSPDVTVAGTRSDAIAAGGPVRVATNPADPGDIVGEVRDASAAEVDAALAAARPWNAPAAKRAAVLARAAAAFEADFGALFALLAREAGKTLPDALGEVREAVDFLHYYGAQAQGLTAPPRGVFACISPWNFPLAIFTGQVAAALAAGNAVVAKPAEQTPLIAARAVAHLHAAGVPHAALQLLPGDGPVVGAALSSDPRVDGIAFTGGTDTARAIARAMADHLAPGAPLIAETGGLNAMVVDSTALPEQAVRDILASAFQSAGQRCSALRCLYVQEDVAGTLRAMLFGAMETLRLGDPWALETDIGPAIDAEAAAGLRAYVAAARAEGRVAIELAAPGRGHFVAPAVIAVPGIAALEREVFGPVLHLATYRAEDLGRVVAAVNATGYGLTFGMHSRIDDRVETLAGAVRAGNAYVNRNQIGAVVGSQPFGGEGLSGTGPKAGGPHYLARFVAAPAPLRGEAAGEAADPVAVQAALDAAPRPDLPPALDLPGPTGESNRLRLVPRAPLLCLGPGREAAAAQARAVRGLGGAAVEVACALAPRSLAGLAGFSGVLWWGDGGAARALAQVLAARAGPIVPLIAGLPDAGHVLHERHLCIDTTAAGGNARLLAAAEDAG